MLLLFCASLCHAGATKSTDEDSSFLHNVFNSTIIGDCITEFVSNKQDKQSRLDDVLNGARAALFITESISKETSSTLIAIYYATLIAHSVYRYQTNRGSIRKINDINLLLKSAHVDATENKMPVEQAAPQAPQHTSANEVNKEMPQEQEPVQQETPAPVPCEAHLEEASQEVANQEA